MDRLSLIEFASALPHVERLAERGNQLSLLASRALGDGLFELRFDLNRAAWRIPYFFATDKRVVPAHGLSQATTKRTT